MSDSLGIEFLKYDEQNKEIVIGNDAYKLRLKNILLEEITDIDNIAFKSELLNKEDITKEIAQSIQTALNNLIVTDSHIANNVITTENIIDAIITEPKIADGAVTEKKLESDLLDNIDLISQISQPIAIVNGDFDHWQEGTNFINLANEVYLADRWRWSSQDTTATITVSRSNDVPTLSESGHNSTYSMRIQVLTNETNIATTEYAMFQLLVEGYNYKPLHGKKCTLSFWFKTEVIGTYSVNFQNTAGTRKHTKTFSVTQSNVWVKYAITLTMDSTGTWEFTNGTALNIGFVLVAGSNHYSTTTDSWGTDNWASSLQVNALSKVASIYISQVKFEIGTIATPFNGKHRVLANDIITTDHIGFNQVKVKNIADNAISEDKLESDVLKKINAISQISQPNTIINGNFDIWQRGTSFTAINNAYHADRFAFSKNGAMEYTLSKSTDVPTQLESGLQSNHSLLATCTTQQASMGAADFAKITYSVEGYDFKKFHGNTATLSFWVKGTKTGIYTVGFANADVSRVQPVEYTIHASDTWEKKTITLTFNSGGAWNFTNGQGLDLSFALSAGTNHHGVSGAWETSNRFATANQINACYSTSNNFRLAQVKLELGSVATPFKDRPIAEELALCQRYFQKSYDKDTAIGTSTIVGCETEVAQTPWIVYSPKIDFSATMRSSPSIVLYHPYTGATGSAAGHNSGGIHTSNVAVSVTNSSKRNFYLGATSAGFTTGEHYRVHWTAEAELN